MSELRALKWRPSTLILEKPHSKWRVQLFSITISILPLSFLSFPYATYYLCFLYLFCLIFSIRFPSCYHVSFPVFYIPHHTSFSPYNVFFLLPLEVNLHTYLTTWLSSCPVGIFPRSHHIIVKISIISKVSPLKWNIIKSTHITVSLFKNHLSLPLIAMFHVFLYLVLYLVFNHLMHFLYKFGFCYFFLMHKILVD